MTDEYTTKHEEEEEEDRNRGESRSIHSLLSLLSLLSLSLSLSLWRSTLSLWRSSLSSLSSLSLSLLSLSLSGALLSLPSLLSREEKRKFFSLGRHFHLEIFYRILRKNDQGEGEKKKRPRLLAAFQFERASSVFIRTIVVAAAVLEHNNSDAHYQVLS